MLDKGKDGDESAFDLTRNHIYLIQNYNDSCAAMRLYTACKKFVNSDVGRFGGRNLPEPERDELASRVFSDVYVPVRIFIFNNIDDIELAIKRATWRHKKRNQRDIRRFFPPEPGCVWSGAEMEKKWEVENYLQAVVGALKGHIKKTLDKMSKREKEFLKDDIVLTREAQRCNVEDAEARKIYTKFGALLRIRLRRERVKTTDCETRQYIDAAIGLLSVKNIKEAFNVLAEHSGRPLIDKY